MRVLSCDWLKITSILGCMSKLLAILLIVFFFTNSVRAEKVNYIIIEEGRFPYQLIEYENLLHAGYITEIVKKIFEDGPHELVPVLLPLRRFAYAELPDYKNWLSYAVRGQSDLYPYLERALLSPVDITPWRCLLISLKETPLNYYGPNSLVEKRIVRVSGYKMPNLQDGMSSWPISFFDAKDQVAALKVLLSRRAEVAVLERRSFKYAVKELELNNYVFYTESCNFGGPLVSVTLAMSSKMSPGLLEYINRRLTILKNNGEIDRILNKYPY